MLYPGPRPADRESGPGSVRMAGGESMKILLVIAAACALLAPIAATALNPSECANLLKRIHHFKTMGDRAEELGNDMWAPSCR